MRHIMFVIIALACTGCTTATVTRADYGRVDARILDGDEQAIWMVPDGTRQVVRVPRQEILAIDHPGDGWVVTGVVLIGLGLLSVGTFAIAGSQEGGLPPELPMVLGASMSYVGVGSVLWYTGHQLKEASIGRSRRSVGVGWSTSF